MSSKKNTICLNLEYCKYEIIHEVAEKLDYTISDSKDEFWDVYWSDLSVSSERVSRLKPFQKINHFPGMMEICRKEALNRNLKKLQKYFPDIYNFFPKSFSLPNQLEAFYYILEHQNKKKNKTYVIKPNGGAMGKGIFLVQNMKDLKCKELNFSVAQEYLDNPLLLDGYKFDLRIYVLVISVDPLKIYVHKEGLARLATEKYEKPDLTNLYDMQMHLTNYAINKDSINYDDDNAMDKGTKRLMSAVLSQIEKISGKDREDIWNEICNIIVYALLTIQPQLAHTYHSSMGRGCNSDNKMCFELLGFDIILDDKLKPWLLEINHSPSYRCDNEIDVYVKEKVLIDLFKILDLNTDDKKDYIKKQKQDLKDRLYKNNYNHGKQHLMSLTSVVLNMESKMNNNISDDILFNENQENCDLDDGTDFDLRYPNSHLSMDVNDNFNRILEKCQEIYPKTTCLCKYCQKIKILSSSINNNSLNSDINNLKEKIKKQDINNVIVSKKKKSKTLPPMLPKPDFKNFVKNKKKINTVRKALCPKPCTLSVQFKNEAKLVCNHNKVSEESTLMKNQKKSMNLKISNNMKKEIKPLKLKSINTIDFQKIKNKTRDIEVLWKRYMLRRSLKVNMRKKLKEDLINHLKIESPHNKSRPRPISSSYELAKILYN